MAENQREAAEPLFFSIKDATRILDASRTTLYAEIAAGRLRATKRGRRTLISRRAVEDYAALLERDA